MLSESETERGREDKVCKERVHVFIPYVNHVGIGGMRQLEWISHTHTHTPNSFTYSKQKHCVGSIYVGWQIKRKSSTVAGRR